jgi:hypothetical protein
LGHDLCILPHAIIGIVMRIFQRLILSFSPLCFNDLFGGHTVLVCALRSRVDLPVRLFTITARLDPLNCCRKLQLLLGHHGLVTEAIASTSRSPSYSGAAVESDGGGGVSIPHWHRKFHRAITKSNQKCMGNMVIHESYTQETPEYTLLPIPQKSTSCTKILPRTYRRTLA